MKTVVRRLAVACTVSALALGSAPLASAQPAMGSSVEPVVVPRPFDIPIWQLPPLPFPFEWEFHLPARSAPPVPAAAPAPAPAPKYGDVCSPDQVYDVYDRKLVCVYAGRPVPTWVYVSAEALNPDGTLNRSYPAG